MSSYKVVESKRVKKAATKKAKNTGDEDDLIEYQRLKGLISSQISDTDGIDASEASTPELIARAKLVITADNPTGQPPGKDSKQPGMLTLMTRLQTYSSILKKNVGLESPASSSKLGNFSFPPGKAPRYERQSPVKKAPPVKVTKEVKFASVVKPLVLEKKTLSTKQYAVSTV